MTESDRVPDEAKLGCQRSAKWVPRGWQSAAAVGSTPRGRVDVPAGLGQVERRHPRLWGPGASGGLGLGS